MILAPFWWAALTNLHSKVYRFNCVKCHQKKKKEIDETQCSKFIHQAQKLYHLTQPSLLHHKVLLRRRQFDWKGKFEKKNIWLEVGEMQKGIMVSLIMTNTLNNDNRLYWTIHIITVNYADVQNLQPKTRERLTSFLFSFSQQRNALFLRFNHSEPQ